MVRIISGKCYRRQDIIKRLGVSEYLLRKLISQGVLKRAYHGIYYKPKISIFGELPPDERSLVKCFLRDDRFVIYTPSQFNGLGLGTTQLYNITWVINRKRSGKIEFGWRRYVFFSWPSVPKKPNLEYFVIEMLNKIDYLLENKYKIQKNMKKKLPELNRRKLLYASKQYGTNRTKNWIRSNLEL